MLEQHLISTNKQDFEQWREKRLEVERDLNELKIIYGHRIEELRNQMDEERKTVISNLEEEYSTMVDTLINKNDKKFAEITSFFRGIKEENLKNIQKNKKMVKDLKEDERTLIKDLHKRKKSIENLKQPRQANNERKKKKEEYDKRLKVLKDEQNVMIDSIKTRKNNIKDIE